ncbi:hypothetical protein IWW40_000607 [Coemansia sp. RSA 1250]|nr:hypothetical protein IWW40_000607 [Coemansia sp. RSA 1250]
MVEGKINKIHGWAAKQPGIKVEPWSYTPRPLGENDVEIKIEYSGICGSDLHTIKEEWSGTSYPAIVGHEIVGKVITKGEKVTHLEEGDMVGVGAQVYGCLQADCDPCSRDLDPHCPRSVFTYNAKYPDGQQAHGGYAEAVRVDSNYAIKLPASLDPAYAPPLMCAGTTVFAPMLRKGVKKGDKVGVVGIGGLGHLAIQYASALGAEVYAFSHSPNKREQCLELGATHFIDTSNKEEVEGVKRTLNYLFVTSNSQSNQYNEFISWMDFEGQIVLLALPKGQMSFSAGEFIRTEVAITGSLIGGVNVLKKTLEFSAKHNILPIIERFPMEKINDALGRVDSGQARYRIVLENPQSTISLKNVRARSLLSQSRTSWIANAVAASRQAGYVSLLLSEHCLLQSKARLTMQLYQTRSLTTTAATPENKDITTDDALIHALQANPPADAQNILKRLAEARSIKSATYLQAIIDFMLEDPATDSSNTSEPRRLKTYLTSCSVCESLMSAITLIEDHSRLKQIDPQIVLQLYRAAEKHQWDLDPDVLQSAVIYLAQSSYFALCKRSGRFIDKSNIYLMTQSDLAQIADLSEETTSQALQTMVDMAHNFSNRKLKITDPRYYSCLVGTLCAHGREADAEELFALAWEGQSHYLGTAVASMMSMHYRLGNEEKANELLSRYSERWAEKWKELESTPIVLSARDAKPKEDDATEHTRIMTVGQLRLLLIRAATPFHQRTLQMISSNDPNGAVEFITNAIRKYSVVLSSVQIDSLVNLLLDRNYLPNAFALCMRLAQPPVAAEKSERLTVQQCHYPMVPSPTVQGRVLLEMCKENDWTRIKALIKGCVITAKQDPPTECMLQLFEHALVTGDAQQANNMINQAVTIGSKRNVAVPMSDEWIRKILTTCVADTALSKKEYIGDIGFKLFLLDSIGQDAVATDNRVLRIATEVLTAKSQPKNTNTLAKLTTLIKSSIKEPSSTSSKLISRPSAQLYAWKKSNREQSDFSSIIASDIFFSNTPYSRIRDWYDDVYKSGLVPRCKSLTLLIYRAASTQDYDFFNTLVHTHLPELLERLSMAITEPRQVEFVKDYKKEVWSTIIHTFASIKQVEEAADYFRRIVKQGSYPTTDACAALLNALNIGDSPLPVLPTDQSELAPTIHGMKPAYPPQGKVPTDMFIVADSPERYIELVAEIGLAMLYSALRQNILHKTRFYRTLVHVLSKAGMVDELKLVFGVVMPEAFRNVPPHLLALQSFVISPDIWATAIRSAERCNDEVLADQWFGDYRMSVMPVLRRSSSRYMRVNLKKYPKHSLLAELALPYYSHVICKDESELDWKYELKRVEAQIEKDRLRALDKLPLPFKGARRMLYIATRVDEHRNMEAAEELIEEMQALFKDSKAPLYVRPMRGSVDMAHAYKLMVIGYISELARVLEELNAGLAKPSEHKYLQKRLVHWYNEWKAVIEKTSIDEDDPEYKWAILSKKDQLFAADTHRLLESQDAASKGL